jgi:hypothetical protein
MKTLIGVMALAPLIAIAAATSPFDGTWKSRLDAAQFSKKPNTQLIVKGMYTCSTCVPKIEVKADGTDQAVTGHAYYDTVAVTVLSDASFRVVRKKAGKIIFDDTYKLSADKNALELNFTDQSGTQSATGDIMLKRVSQAPAGAHAASGSWVYDKIVSMSDSGITVSFVSTPNGLKMNAATGQSYDAAFGGPAVMQQGDIGKTMVSLKKIGPREFEETDQRDGKTTDITKFVVSADGKSITATDHDVMHERTDTFVLDRQP